MPQYPMDFRNDGNEKTYVIPENCEVRTVYQESL